jgi:two-component system cell cycle response regulator
MELVMLMGTPLTDLGRWNRKILNTYWVLIMLITLVELFTVMAFNQKNFKEDCLQFVIIPSLCLTVVMIGTELVVARINRFSEYAISLTATIMSTIVVYAQYDVRNIVYVFGLPLLVSISYLKKRVIIFTSIANIGFYFLAYYLNNYLYTHTKPWDLVTTIFTFMISTYLAVNIVERGLDYRESLLSTQKDRQDLLIKNTLMDRQIKVDALTDLYNHMTFYEYLTELIKQNHTNDLPIQLALVDIDDYKMINDTFGHRAGDMVLIKIADIIKSSIGANDFAARYGGEEFALLYTEKSAMAAYNLLEEIRKKIAATKYEEINNRPVTVSIGLKSYDRNGKEKLFRDADRALYDSKRNGKNRTTLSP